jgi:hypothetical protein
VRHFLAPPIIGGDAERATARSYCQVIVQPPDGPCAIDLVAEYEDVCVKIDGEWLFEERIIRELLEGPRSAR